MSPEHYSDESLISYQDGEVSRRIRVAIDNHLEQCWTCRTRLSELERQIEEFTKLFDEQEFPGPDWAPAAKARVLERLERVGHEPRPVTTFGFWSASTLRWWAGVAATVLCAVALWLRSRPMLPVPAELVSRTQRVESQLYSSSAHQAFRVEVHQIRPVQLLRKGRIEIWSDPSAARYALRWRGEDGSLRHALWRPSAHDEYVFKAGQGTTGVREGSHSARAFSVTELAKFGLDADQIENGFMRWLESRTWAPVEFASGLRMLMDQDGVVVKVERVSDDGTALRLTAWRQSGSVTTQVVVEVDSENYRPRLQSVRFKNGESEIVFTLFAERLESVTPAFSEAVFTPDVPWGPPRLPAPVTLPEPPAFRLDARRLQSAEIEADYELHRLGLCMGEPFEMVHTGKGGLLIRGVTETAQQRNQIIAAVSRIGDPSWLSFEIRTVEEAVRTSDSNPEAQTGPAQPVIVSEAPASSRLAAYLQSRTDPVDAGVLRARVTKFSNQATALSEAAVQHAWAVRRLSERYRSGDVSAESRLQLQRMYSDHIDELQRLVRQARSLLVPVWEPIHEMTPDSASDSSESASSISVINLFHNTEHIRQLTLSLFTSVGIPENVSQTPPKIRSADEVGAELVATLSRLDSELKRAEREPVSAVSGGTNVAGPR